MKHQFVIPRTKRAVAGLLAGALALVSAAPAAAHSTHYGIVDDRGCRVNPKAPLMQYQGSNTWFFWGVARIGEGCTAHTTAVHVRAVWNVDNEGVWQTGTVNRYVGQRQIDATGGLGYFHCSWNRNWQIRSAVGVAFDNNDQPGSWHRDADEGVSHSC